jgi:hypothetical protein
MNDPQLQRYLVIMADASRRRDEVITGDELVWLSATSANVLAEDQDAAMIAATDEMLDERFVPVVAWPAERLRAVLATLENVPLSPSRPVIFNQGSHEDDDEASKSIFPGAEDIMRRTSND